MLVTLITSFVPVAGTRVQRIEKAVERIAGRVLSTVLLGAVMVLIFAPISLVLRLLRREPLALGRSAGDPSFWRPHLTWRRGPLHRHVFAYDRIPATTAGRGLRVGAALGLLLVLALLDVGLGAAIDRVRGDPPGRSLVAVKGDEVPAGRGQPWRTLLPEITDAFAEERYDPYLGWRVLDYTGRYVTIRDGVRTSYQGAGAGSTDALDVFFLGGSTMLGAYQRDSTPSPRSSPGAPRRPASRAGHQLRHPGYAIWQEIAALPGLLTAGQVPTSSFSTTASTRFMSRRRRAPGRHPTHHDARKIDGPARPSGRQDRGSRATRCDAWT